MSSVASARYPARNVRTETAAFALGLGTVLFLLLRPAFAARGNVPLAAGYLAIGAASIAALRGSSRRTATSRRWLVPLAVGTLAVLVARLVAGPAPALPIGVGIVAVNVGAAIAEEAFFRGFLFARLERWGVGIAVVASAAAFALLHVPLYGMAAFPVDLGAGLLLSWQRAASGTWTVPAATHAVANVLAVLR
jgi:membrane protease YdiL (CAAX protease family)